MVYATPKNPFIVTMLQPDHLIDFKQAADIHQHDKTKHFQMHLD